MCCKFLLVPYKTDKSLLQLIMLADVDATFVKAAGLANESKIEKVAVDAPLVKSKRYTLFVDDGVIKKQNVEEEEEEYVYTVLIWCKSIPHSWFAELL